MGEIIMKHNKILKYCSSGMKVNLGRVEGGMSTEVLCKILQY